MRSLRVLLSLLLTVTLAGCAAPTLSYSTYRYEVAQTARQVNSAIASARVATMLDLQGKMTLSVTETVVSNAESDADSAQETLETRQPPDNRSIRLHERASTTISDAVDEVRALRIAVRAGNTGNMRSLLKSLHTQHGKLRQLQKVAP